tara:strand:- start:4525 stop:5136 length:612 start_codon:yes stop_codon:yes gene_type:complete
MNNLFNAGGFVMWPLLICSITSLSCILERFYYWANIDWHNKNTLEIIIENFIKYPNDSIKFLKKNKNYPLSRILIKAYDYKSQDSKSFHLALTYAIQSSIKDIRKFDNLFSTIITVSPLLGLLGTILGLIKSFALLDLGKGDINSIGVTGGISEALVSTAAGLIVAIFTLLFANYFKSQSNNHINLIQEYSAKIEIFNSSNIR